MHFLDFLEKCEGRTLIIMQFPIPVTLLLQYIGDLQTCVPLLRGNCSDSRWHDSYTTTSPYILHWCRSRTTTWFSETSCVGVPHTDVLSTASTCDLILALITLHNSEGMSTRGTPYMCCGKTGHNPPACAFWDALPLLPAEGHLAHACRFKWKTPRVTNTNLGEVGDHS